MSEQPTIRMFATTIYGKTYLVSAVNFDSRLFILWTEMGKREVPIRWIRSLSLESPFYNTQRDKCQMSMIH